MGDMDPPRTGEGVIDPPCLTHGMHIPRHSMLGGTNCLDVSGSPQPRSRLQGLINVVRNQVLDGAS
jgi:hypothetical protein